MSWDRESSRNWHEHQRGNWQGNWNHNWHGHHHGGNWWIAPLVILGLIVLTHGWILIVPLVAIAAFVFFGFLLPKLAWHMNSADWHSGDWAGWHDHWHQSHRQHMQQWGEKRRHHFQNWGGNSPFWGDENKPKRKNDDDIEYV